MSMMSKRPDIRAALAALSMAILLCMAVLSYADGQPEAPDIPGMDAPYGLKGWSIVPDEPTGAAEALTGPEYFALAEESYEMGDYERAQGFYNSALPLLSGDTARQAKAHERLAFIYAAFGETEKVYGEFLLSLKIDPSLQLDPDMVSPKVYESFVKARDEVVREGTLVVNCDPPGAEVYLDGESLGDAPVRRGRIPEGTYTLTLKKDGYETSTGSVVIKKDVTLTVDDTMVQATGVVEITSTPPGVSVTFDGRQAGATPVRVDNVRGGEHSMSFKREYYEPADAAITVVKGDHTSYNAVLKRRVLVIAAATRAGDGVDMLVDALSGPVGLHVSYTGLAGLGEDMSRRGLDPASLGFLSSRKKALSLEDSAALSGVMEDARVELALYALPASTASAVELHISLFSTASDMVDTVTLSAKDMDGLKAEVLKFAGKWRGTAMPSRPCMGMRLVDRAAGGVEVVDVVAGLPAAKSGIAAGDMITSVDGAAVSSKADIDIAVAAGGVHTFTCVSRGREATVHVDAQECPVETPPGSGDYLYNIALVENAGYLDSVPATKGVPDDARGIAALDLGNVYMHMGEYGKAVAAYKEVDTKAVSGLCTGTALYRMGEAYEKLGRWPEAADAYRKAMLLYPEARLGFAEGQKVGPLARERLKSMFELGLVMEKWWM